MSGVKDNLNDNLNEANRYTDIHIKKNLDKYSCDYDLHRSILCGDDELTEEDFYPPEDNRIWGSGIDDIKGGDNFVDYAKYFYGIYEKEIFDI
jgi:hypothetical protein